MTLDEILKEYYYCGETKTIEKEKQAILSWILTDLLPKERPAKEIHIFIDGELYKILGYNQCLTDIKERMK